MVLDAGTALAFGVFVIMALTLPDDFLERWLQPLGNASLLAIVFVSIIIDKPFTLQYARKSTPPDQWDEPGFVYVCQLLAWGVGRDARVHDDRLFSIPPIVDGDATVRDEDDTLSVICYWVLPFMALGLAMIFTSKYSDWFIEVPGGEDADRAPSAVEPPATLAVPVDDQDAPLVHLDPVDVLADETAGVRVTGAAPGATVTVSAETIDAFGHRWRSTITAEADATGTLRPSRSKRPHLVDGLRLARCDSRSLHPSGRTCNDGRRR